MGNSGPFCDSALQDHFGPTVPATCFGGFDFTLLFEETVLTDVPLGLAALWAVGRVAQLWKTEIKVRSSWLLPLKLLSYGVYDALQIALLVLWSGSDAPRTRATLATTALTLALYTLLPYVSFLEHTRSLRPSTLLSIFLGGSTILDLARVRTLFLIAEHHSVSPIFLAAFIVKLVILGLEICSKKKLFQTQWRNVSPEAAAGILSRAGFVWLNALFARGFRNILTVDMLTPIDEDILAATTPLTLMEKWEKVDKSSENALLWLFVSHYKSSLLAGVLPRLTYTGFTFAQPFLISRVLDFTTEPSNPNSKKLAGGLIGAYAIVYIGIAISYAVYQHKTYRVMTMFRGSLITLIFSKTLRMGSTEIANAEAITLMSADMDRIGTSMDIIHEVYASFLELGLSLWLIWRLLGIAVVAPTIYITICLVLSFPVATAAGNAQVPWLEAIESRLAVTTKILGAMKAVKLTGVADVIMENIRALRVSEIRASKRHRMLNVGVTLSSFLSSVFTPVWGLGLYMILAQARGTPTLTEGIVFAALSLFELQDQPLNYIVEGLERLQTIANSFARIQEHLETSERVDPRIFQSAGTSEKLDPDVAISVRNLTASYSEEGKPILNDINLDIYRGKTTMVIGSVGCGKSTLLKLLLGELPCSSGSITTTFSTTAYCPQTPWITWDVVRQNIVGMSVWDEKWYDTVVRACNLDNDFEQFPDGDQTHTGTRGARLSGGQQIRVSLARALYSRNRLMLLDDVLTGLDRMTERDVLNNVFGPDGLVKYLGSTVVLATNSAAHLGYADHIITLDGAGNAKYQEELQNGHIPEMVIPLTGTTSRPKLEVSDETLQEAGLADHDEPHDGLPPTGDLTVYLYFARIAQWRFVLAYLCTCAVFVFGVTFPPVWVQMWMNANVVNPNRDLGYWLGIYALIAAIALIGCAATDALFNLVIVPRISWKVHELLLSTTMGATTAFLTSTGAGSTTNRFSQDLQLIDNDLPTSFDRTIYQFLSLIVSAVLVFIASGYVAAAIPLCLVVIYLIQSYYLRTSRQLRLLDIEAKAPLFSHFLETLGGLACVRAYGWSEQYLDRNHSVLNRSQKPYYLMWCIQRWLTLVLDLFVAGIAVILVGIATNFRTGSTGFLGVALYNVVSFSITLQQFVTEWTLLETSFGAISRVRSYVATTPIEDCETRPADLGPLDPDWPTAGSIIFKDVQASYDTSTAPVFKHISFAVEAGEKVAICGRTGSGKSSLISTLLRLLDPDSGSILIDGRDISTVSRQQIRQRLNVLPQEPFFLHGTVRDNIDPFNTGTDEELISALIKVKLWDIFEAEDGLDGDMVEEQLSHGQRQLFCLARAMVRPSKILIIDEATSNVDSETDEHMQQLIRENFGQQTIVAVAHKLQTILDFDRVVLLDDGSIVETGNPQELLAKPTSLFKRLYEMNGNQ